MASILRSMSSSTTELLSPNVLATVTLRNVARDKTGRTKDSSHLTFSREQPEGNKKFIFDDDEALPPELLPPSIHPTTHGNLNVTCVLGKTLGMGDTSFVLDAEIIQEQSSPELSQMRIPPLVAKIARGYGNGGSARRRVDDETFDPPPKVVYLILFEKLGGHIQRGTKTKEALGTDLMAVIREVGQCCVYNHDIRPEKFLEAPTHEGALPSLPSPRTRVVHSYRWIDFSQAVLTNAYPSALDDMHEGRTQTMIENDEWENPEEAERVRRSLPALTH
ncbi:hypothetical protein EIP91_009201 [Steccherinum ochraceum]|uniref:Protein kinase domain-containing protein n=1 Tax=Steccherinum ochraceum TaxID=92696 RepID=A0A4R0RTP1_9APHY|nr:hypothetical protein EIP91_009201 [Steccherinum ochraceum]